MTTNRKVSFTRGLVALRSRYGEVEFTDSDKWRVRWYDPAARSDRVANREHVALVTEEGPTAEWIQKFAGTVPD